jgi:hypothetical protein
MSRNEKQGKRAKQIGEPVPIVEQIEKSIFTMTSFVDDPLFRNSSKICI